MYACSSKPNSLVGSKVSERTLLADDADGHLLRANVHALDIAIKYAPYRQPWKSTL